MNTKVDYSIEMEPLVSVIVPVYNMIRFLPKCIESICSQTYFNLEIILINDGSTDKSGSICDEYMLKDDRIKVVHKENGGVSSARNRGLDIALGKWVVFIDADDHVTEKYIEQFLVYGESDLVVTNYHLNIGDSPLEYQKVKIKNYLQTISHSLIANVPWGKLYDSKIIKQYSIRFDENTRFGEDSLFNFSYLLYCNSIKIIPVCGYNYTVDEPPSERYMLTAKEIRQTMMKLTTFYELLEQKYKCQFDMTFDIALHVSIYPLKRLMATGDDEYFELYQTIYPNRTKENLYRDWVCSPMVRVITRIKSLYELGRYNEGKSFCFDAWRIYKQKFRTIQYPYPIHRILGILLSFGLLRMTHIFLLLYAYLKNK